MASKGVTKTGEAYCLACGAGVEPSADRCPSCYSELEGEAKAFLCPKCSRVLELGTPKCGSCGMKFKVKTIRPSDAMEDERMVARLIGADRSEPEPASEMADQEGVEATDQEASEFVTGLVEALAEMADLRAEAASAMGTGISQTRKRLAGMSQEGLPDLLSEDLETELKGISQDLSRLREVMAKADHLAQLAAKALSIPGLEQSATLERIRAEVEELRKGAATDSADDREEQLRKREEMVDRKIKAYAQKKKELNGLESSLRSGAEGATTTSQATPELAPEDREWLDQRSSVLSELDAIGSALSVEDLDEEDFLSSLKAILDHSRKLVATQAELQGKLQSSAESEEDIRRVMKALDDLLGQLPEAAIQRFTSSEDFKLYQKVLDRLKI